MQNVELYTLSKDPSVPARKLKELINMGNTIISFSIDNSGLNYCYLTVVIERSKPDAGFKGLSTGGR